MKLSKIQQKIISLMNQGWRLSTLMGLNPTASIHNAEIEGCNSINVSLATIYALMDKKVIKASEKFPTIEYTLIESGEHKMIDTKEIKVLKEGHRKKCPHILHRTGTIWDEKNGEHFVSICSSCGQVSERVKKSEKKGSGEIQSKSKKERRVEKNAKT